MRSAARRSLTLAALLSLAAVTGIPPALADGATPTQATAATGSVSVSVSGAASVLATVLDPVLGLNMMKLSSGPGVLTVTGLVPGEAYAVSSRTGGTSTDPVTLVAASGTAVSLFSDSPGAPLGRPISVFGYASVNGQPQVASVALQQVLPSGAVVGLTHVTTDASGRFSMPFTPTTTTTLRSAVTLGGVLVSSAPLTLTTTPTFSTLRVVHRAQGIVISGVLSPGSRTSAITVSTQGRGAHRLGRAAVQAIAGGRVRFSLTVKTSAVASAKTLLISVPKTARAAAAQAVVEV